MKLKEILTSIQPVKITGNQDIEITGVDIDSRQVESGHLFMAMHGTQTDGHAYIPAAVEKVPRPFFVKSYLQNLQKELPTFRLPTAKMP